MFYLSVLVIWNQTLNHSWVKAGGMCTYSPGIKSSFHPYCNFNCQPHVQELHPKCQQSSSLTYSLWLGLSPCSFHCSFQPLALLPSLPLSHFTFCFVAVSIFKTTSHFQGNNILKINCPFVLYYIGSYINNISVVLIHIPIYLLWRF